MWSSAAHSVDSPCPALTSTSRGLLQRGRGRLALGQLAWRRRLTSSKGCAPPRCRQADSTATAGRSGHSGGRRSLLRGVLGGMALSAGLGAIRGFTRPAAAAAVSDIEKVLEDPQWPPQFPLRPSDFERYDESPDTVFYSMPRFVAHIDDAAIKALTRHYEAVFPPSGRSDTALLDICSSWISHYPEGYTAGRISGLGMNEQELARNAVLTDFAVKDLNKDPSLPYEDNTFDVITNAVSVDYLSRPLEVFREMHRVLKPGGLAVMSFSNRCFPTKAIAIWTGSGDADHVWIVGSYFHYSVSGGFTAPQARDITPPAPLFGRTDPMYVVFARKQSGGTSEAAA